MPTIRKKIKSNATLTILRFNFPFELLASIIFFIYCSVILFKQILSEPLSILTIEITLLIFVCVFLIIFLTLLFCNAFRYVIITKDTITIKRYLPLQLEKYYSEQVKGYELYEVLIQGEPAFIVRIVRNNDKVISLHRGYCRNYDNVHQVIQKTDFHYLGKKAFQHKNRNTLLKIAKWSAILYPILFGLHMLFKLLFS